jgi:hypothetical protein
MQRSRKITSTVRGGCQQLTVRANGGCQETLAEELGLPGSFILLLLDCAGSE